MINSSFFYHTYVGLVIRLHITGHVLVYQSSGIYFLVVVGGCRCRCSVQGGVGLTQVFPALIFHDEVHTGKVLLAAGRSKGRVRKEFNDLK